jgi:hypothetical protein
MLRYRVVNLGQAAICPEPPTAKDLNCQQTPDGGVLCSDGTYFPPGCPSAPPVTIPGVTPYTRENGELKLSTPAPHSLGEETGTEFPWLLVGVSVAGLVVALVW